MKTFLCWSTASARILLMCFSHESCRMMNLVYCLISYKLTFSAGNLNNTVMLTLCLCVVFLITYIDYERMVQITVFIVINFLNLEMDWASYIVYVNVTMIVTILVVVDILLRTFYSMVLICVHFNYMHLNKFKEFCIEPFICSFSFEMLLLT